MLLLRNNEGRGLLQSGKAVAGGAASADPLWLQTTDAQPDTTELPGESSGPEARGSAANQGSLSAAAVSLLKARFAINMFTMIMTIAQLRYARNGKR